MMKNLVIGLVAAAVVVASGCSNRTEQKAKEAAHETGQAAEKTGQMIESAAKDAVQNTKEATASAAEATENAAEKVGAALQDGKEAVGAAMETADVKTALIGAEGVDASHIDVDTNHETKVVSLRGWVPTADQKTLAGKIAAEHATGYRIDNQLRIGG